VRVSGKLAGTVGASAAALLLAIVPFYEGTIREGHLDPIGIVTACTGHTGTAELGRAYSDEECDALLDADLTEAARTVDRCVTVPLEPHQRAAFVSFAFNVGPGKAGVKDGFCTLKSGRQPTFLLRLNAGDYAGACRGLNEHGNWTTAGGKQLRGLVRRRADERALCEGRPEALARWGGS
jgi:lysozyme